MESLRASPPIWERPDQRAVLAGDRETACGSGCAVFDRIGHVVEHFGNPSPQRMFGSHLGVKRQDTTVQRSRA